MQLGLLAASAPRITLRVPCGTIIVSALFHPYHHTLPTMMGDTQLPQLPAGLHTSLKRSIENRRPLVYHLTPDSSWLLSLPLPSSSPPSTSDRRRRTRYNILIDPWLSGVQIDYYSWFSLQTHASASAVPTIAALEQLLQEIEKLCLESQSEFDQTQAMPNDDNVAPSLIDAVIVSHEFTGTCHHLLAQAGRLTSSRPLSQRDTRTM